jgi:uncharacterized protein (DUF1800 family)
VSDDPPPALVSRMAARYSASGTAIRPVLETMFSSPEFAAARGSKLRRPFEHTVAAFRALGVQPGKDGQGLRDLTYMLQLSGHAPLAWPMPNGYPDVAASWQSPAAALNQFNGIAGVVHGWWPDKLGLVDPKRLVTSSPRTADAAVKAASRRVLWRAPSAAEHDAAIKLLAGSRLPKRYGKKSWEQQEAVALTATLLLNSPAFLSR